MNEQVNQSAPETTEGREKYTFNFRPVTPAKLDKLKAEVDGSIDVDKDFEVYERESDDPNSKVLKYKRKPVVVNLEVPDFIASMKDNLLKQIAIGYIADYVKANFVEQFLPVGNHSWETIKADAASGRGGKVAISDAVLKLTAQHFGNYVGQATGNEEMGKRIAALVEGKCTKSAISKYLGTFSPELVEKLQTRLDQWGEYVADSGDDNADELAEGYAFVQDKLAKLYRASTTNIAELANNLL